MGVAFEGLPDDKVDLALKNLDTLMQEIEEMADGFPPQNKDGPTDDRRPLYAGQRNSCCNPSRAGGHGDGTADKRG